ncbi:MAG: hydroxyphenylacetyl-CoA thioesterase PaaI [Halioglobus sp.]|nr:hydroxyphenylacetyl-CoA thioesterase PaaI [Halioglobus sp.]MCB1709014.1 hydroxyphenylacetyl-CoA thioesterase PaaI [Halioglobus sp.]MCP5122584.1 hydroxyphenylacetyl-CoA thioesterase PaaI [Pseudomonadales bacterium]MCP5191751.1 hydroxyphenylacetyl-CoA thioesterase PaaI [Pseudomonadales bacterium]
MDPQQLAEASAAAMWAGDRASHALAIKVDAIAPGMATLSMAVREDMLNGHAICHGGYIFTLADTAFAYACNSQNHNTVAAGARIEFLAPGRLGDRLSASARQVVQGNRTGVYDVVVSKQDGAQIALFRGNSHRVGGALVEAETGEPLDE